ncbi:MAG TPA: GHMP kinase [bacterium]|nr:GHMP kinase [Candidatus Omnitrophota bacterium]HOJ61913.1 GHMP kinase [bacterium]HOL95778.1 GHMP kinase [bacterium]HPP02850.1 GHMP kinase [bacterium]HXK93857.1 GHMP kinase [bacterium]
MASIIETFAYARAGLIGNPSDGYYGKTISISVRNFRARVLCYPAANLEIRGSAIDQPVWRSIDELREGVKKYGYYGGIRLIRAIIKRFADYCDEKGIRLPKRNCALEYESDIPGRVGLAGSSAIITATLRALMQFYEVEIPKEIQPNIILQSERDELGIGAGLQDRVIQVYENMVYMDFDRELLQTRGYGHYEPMDPALLPNLYIAYDTRLSEGSEVFHNNIRERFDRGDPEVVSAMKKFAQLADEARRVLLAGEKEKLADLMNQNFDLRSSLYKLRKSDLDLVHYARLVGASSKFAGSGGAVIGTYEDERMLRRLREVYAKLGAEVIIPQITAEN